MNQFKKSKIVMLPTEKASQIHMNTQNHLFYFSKAESKLINGWSNQYLYLLSDEEIKEREWGMDIETREYFQCKKNLSHEDCYIGTDDRVYITHNDPHWCYKVIATTDPSLTIPTFSHYSQDLTKVAIYKDRPLPRPSDSFVKKYCELGGIDEVMVEYEDLCDYDDDNPCGYPDKPIWRLKVAPDNTITIKSVKDSWSREEITNKLWDFNQQAMLLAGCATQVLTRESFDKWIEKNL